MKSSTHYVRTVGERSGSVAIKGSGATIREMIFYCFTHEMINWVKSIGFLKTVRKIYGWARKTVCIYLTEKIIHLLFMEKILYMTLMKTYRAI